MIFNFPWETMAALWLIPIGIAVFLIIVTKRKQN